MKSHESQMIWLGLSRYVKVCMGVLQETAGNVAWANDNKTLFYVTKDKLDRPFKVGH